MARRPPPKQVERPSFDAIAAGANCRLCPLSRTCKPVAPRLNPQAALTVVEGWPTRSEDEQGKPTRHPASELLRKNLAAANVDEYGYTYSILCKPPAGTPKKDIQDAIACCSERLRRDVAPEPADASGGGGQRKWILSLGSESFRATTAKLANLDDWVGAPLDGQWPGVRVIPTWSPGFILKADGSRFGGVFGAHVWRAAYLATGRLGDFEWPEDIVDGGRLLTETLVRISTEVSSGAEVSVDIETRGLGLESVISCIGFSSSTGACCVQLPASSSDDVLVRRILSAGVMVGQNISSFDRQVLTHHGYVLTPHYEDTLLAASILDPQLPKNLGALVGAEFHAEAHKAAFKADKETGVLQGMWDSTDPGVERERRIYCMRDAYMTLMVWNRMKQRLKEYV